MKLIVNPHKIEIVKNPVNEKEINVTKCEFEFAEEITAEYVKKAYFTFKGTSYEVLIENNECDIPQEVLEEVGQVEVGVVAYLLDGDEYIKRYNPSPAYFESWIGSLKGKTENTEPITPTDKEQIEQALQDMETKVDNIDIEANKVGDTTTITITRKDGTQETTEIEDGIDGVGLDYNWSGTSLGIKREDEQSYEYVNLKGDKGDPGAIKMIIVNELPATGQDDTIYLVPLATPESQENNYAEYVYINGAWELLGKIGIQVDLTDYYTKTETNNLLDTKNPLIDSSHKLSSDLVDDTNATNKFVTTSDKTTWNNKYDKPSGGIPKTDLASDVQTSLGKADSAIQSGDLTNYVTNTDYATSSVGGVIKVSTDYGLNVADGNLRGVTRTYAQYSNLSNNALISKGTLENVITGKDLTTKTYVDGLVGDIATTLDTIQGEVI